ncbi:MAG: hypothetical protein CVV25_06800 [Ignavibacteriae bacterium HGW-Ignavibacteriae-4]|nr:MAG: hypothetical protein CVV25_06800 [Ignavibacteriae bacterium HGW-Ignavibacteriae-4]
MNREIVNNILQKIEETNTLLLEEESEIKFCKIYEGILFKTVIPHRGDEVGLYKLTVKGKSVLNSGRNQ